MKPNLWQINMKQRFLFVKTFLSPPLLYITYVAFVRVAVFVHVSQVTVIIHLGVPVPLLSSSWITLYQGFPPIFQVIAHKHAARIHLFCFTMPLQKPWAWVTLVDLNIRKFSGSTSCAPILPRATHSLCFFVKCVFADMLTIIAPRWWETPPTFETLEKNLHFSSDGEVTCEDFYYCICLKVIFIG